MMHSFEMHIISGARPLFFNPNSLDNKRSCWISKDFYCSATMLRELGLNKRHSHYNFRMSVKNMFNPNHSRCNRMQQFKKSDGCCCTVHFSAGCFKCVMLLHPELNCFVQLLIPVISCCIWHCSLGMNVVYNLSKKNTPPFPVQQDPC